MARFENKKAARFLASISEIYIASSGIESRSKFNFSYFDSNQEASSDFEELSHDQLLGIVKKIKEYSRDPLTYWQNQRCGGGGLKVFEIYGDFPRNSDFQHPVHVPKDVRWARFRLDNLGRLVGFVVPTDYEKKGSSKKQLNLDTNTFYVVFVDLEHRFYKVEPR